MSQRSANGSRREHYVSSGFHMVSFSSTESLRNQTSSKILWILLINPKWFPVFLQQNKSRFIGQGLCLSARFHRGWIEVPLTEPLISAFLFFNEPVLRINESSQFLVFQSAKIVSRTGVVFAWMAGMTWLHAWLVSRAASFSWSHFLAKGLRKTSIFKRTFLPEEKSLFTVKCKSFS